jgi:hypothetical protein
MNRAAHYQEAERLLDRAAEIFNPLQGDDEHDALVARAQVHATLAIAELDVAAGPPPQPVTPPASPPWWVEVDGAMP